MAAATSPYNQLTSLSAPAEFGGKSLRQLAAGGEQLGRSDLVAQILGISENTPLNAGQTYDLYGTDLGSQEGAYLKSRFTPADSPEVRAVKPAINTLESGRAPLKKRYDDLIASIQGRRSSEIQQTDINSARELGRRGITTDSTLAGQYQQQQRVPVDVQYSGLEAETGLNAEQQQQNINQAIAQLQAQAGSKSVDQGLNLYQFNQQQQTQQQQYDRTLAQALEIAKLQNKPNATANKYESVTGGNKLFSFNPLTGQYNSGPTLQSLRASAGGGGATFNPQSDWEEFKASQNKANI